jgi:Tfp pilus assembly protein PilF
MKKPVTIAAALFLAACSRPENTAVSLPLESPEQMLGIIRANDVVSNEVVFQALSDDAVTDMREQAMRLEAQGNYVAARELLDKALVLQNSDPSTLQQRAELAIREGDWPSAERLAMKSFDSGAKLGQLCRRNWLTVHYARKAQGQGLDGQLLAKSLGDCTIIPPARM